MTIFIAASHRHDAVPIPPSVRPNVLTASSAQINPFQGTASWTKKQNAVFIAAWHRLLKVLLPPSAQLHVPASAILPTASRSIMLPGSSHYFSTARHFKFWHNLAPVVLPGLCWPCETVPWEAAGALCVMGLVEFVIRQPLLSELIPQSVIQQVHTNELLLVTLVELVEILSRRGIDCWYRMQIFSLGVTA